MKSILKTLLFILLSLVFNLGWARSSSHSMSGGFHSTSSHKSSSSPVSSAKTSSFGSFGANAKAPPVVPNKSQSALSANLSSNAQQKQALQTYDKRQAVIAGAGGAVAGSAMATQISTASNPSTPETHGGNVPGYSSANNNGGGISGLWWFLIGRESAPSNPTISGQTYPGQAAPSNVGHFGSAEAGNNPASPLAPGINPVNGSSASTTPATFSGSGLGGVLVGLLVLTLVCGVLYYAFKTFIAGDKAEPKAKNYTL